MCSRRFGNMSYVGTTTFIRWRIMWTDIFMFMFSVNSTPDFQPFERVSEVGFENTLPILSPNKQQTVTQTEPVSPLKPSQKLNRMDDVSMLCVTVAGFKFIHI